MINLKEPEMDVITDESKIDKVLTRGVKEIFPSPKDLKKVMLSGKRLRLYTGIDPTANFLHVGHFIWMRRLAQFQKLGHQVIFLIGGFTAMIGDPDKEYTREPLTKEQVWENFESYRETARKFIDFNWKRNPVTILNNFDWLSQIKLEDWLQIMSKITMQHLLSHEMFATRIKEEKPIRLHEVMYPLMQGFDGVVMGVDLEQGGSDQTFNMLTGRILSRELIGKEKFVLTNKLLTDPTGQKMGKTTDNAISSKDTPENMFGKIMSWPDEMISAGFEMLTYEDLKTIEKEIEQDPMKAKKKLAFEVVKMVRDEDSANEAQDHFERTVQKGETPKEVQIFKYSGKPNALELGKFLAEKKIIASNSEAKRLIQQGGFEVNNEKVTDPESELNLKDKNLIKIGKRKFVKIITG